MSFRRVFAKIGAIVAVVCIVGLVPVDPAHAAASSTAGDATPNFTESGNCGTYGLRGPLSPTTSIASRIYGPFADFFGRTETQVYYSTSIWEHPNGKFYRVHNRTLGAFRAAAEAIIASGSDYSATSGAGYTWRNISGSRQMSHHAVANAIDINPATNPHTTGALITDMPPAYVDAWRSTGFCWGGDWRFSKDAMHYTWRGPAFRNGLTSRLVPYAPLSDAASFTQRAFRGGVAVPGSADLYAMSDRRRDGADDLYAVVDRGGAWKIQVAGAVSGFEALGVRRDTASPSSGNPMLADADGDGRADLWVFNSTGTISADIYFDADRFQSLGRTVTTGATWSPDAELGLAVFDQADWLPDLFVIRRDTATVEVYSSSSDYQTLIHSSSLPVTIGADHLVLADRDDPTDGTADLWLVGMGSASTVRIVRYDPGVGYSGPVSVLSTSIEVSADSAVMPGDYDGDGWVDLYVLSGSQISVWLGGVPDRPISQLSNWFTPDGPMTFDAGPVCSGPCDTIGYVDRGGVWRLAYETAWAPEETSFYYGDPGDEPFMGDWNCDGTDTPGLYRPSDGYVYLRNANTQGIADLSYFFGNPGDIPLAGDFDGDGCDTVSLYRPSEGRFYIINELGSGDSGLGAAEFSFVFGETGDQPFVGDFDGNGSDDIGMHRDTTGRVYMRLSLDSGPADLEFSYGLPGDQLVAGDWDGDGIDTPAVFRPSDGNWYVRLDNTAGTADHVIPFGLRYRGFLPVAGKTLLGGS